MHVCVVLWSFTGILGKLITLGALPLVWWRMVIVTASLLAMPRFWSGLAQMRARSMGVIAGIGVLLSLHWVTFYAAIRCANASVAATCMALTPVMIALLEPAVARRALDLRELGLGVAVIPGVALVVGGTPSEMRLGIGMGIISAALIALVTICNKRCAMQASPLSVTGIEMIAGVSFLPLLAPLLPDAGNLFRWPERHDLWLLLVLAFACTLVPYVLALVALRELSPFSSSLVINLEPVYTMLLAIPFFHEQRELGVGFYAGAAVVLGVVFSQPLMLRQKLAPMAGDSRV